MGRAIWTGNVGFGLVQIPVALHGAEDKDELDLTLLDRRDFAPVGYERVNKKTGKEVAWKDIVKGYEHSAGKFVVLTEQDLKHANVEATRQIDILDFVEFSQIDPRYIDRPYYVAPQKNGKKAYALLREALKRTGMAGIGKVVIRTRQHLAAVVAHERSLLLVLLRFADELRSESDLDLPDSSLKTLGIKPGELAMAEKLVRGMVGEFKPEKYRDDYRVDLLKLIKSKAKAGELNRMPSKSEEKPEKADKSAKVIDLSALLAESVKRPSAGHGNAKPKARARKKATPAPVHHHRRSA